MRKKLYNVLEGEKTVLEGVTAGEVKEFLKDPNINVWQYSDSGQRTQGKYIIQDTGKTQLPVVRKKQQVNTIPANMWEEWEKVCAVFREKMNKREVAQ